MGTICTDTNGQRGHPTYGPTQDTCRAERGSVNNHGGTIRQTECRTCGHLINILYHVDKRKGPSLRTQKWFCVYNILSSGRAQSARGSMKWIFSQRLRPDGAVGMKSDFINVLQGSTLSAINGQKESHKLHETEKGN